MNGRGAGDRALREALARVRGAERAAREALDELSHVRRELEARLAEEAEEAEAAEAAPSPPSRAVRVGPGRPPEPDTGFVPVLAALAVVLIGLGIAGWIVVCGGWVGGAEEPSPEAAGPVAEAEIPDPDARPAPPRGEGAPAASAEEQEGTGGDAASPLSGASSLGPAERAALYDSLWSARAAAFDPLLESLASSTDHEGVGDAVRAWREGATLGPLAADLLHSALLQLVLRRETGRDLALDGQVLRNPCRGASCGALLELWEGEGERLGLPAMPDDAARDAAALGVAERALLLRALAG